MSNILKGFVTFEGIDGCGKTTQIKHLEENFAGALVDFQLGGRFHEPRPVLFEREPTPHPIGKIIRQILTKEMPAESRTLEYLWCADRIEHIQHICESIACGNIVVSDRYKHSGIAYAADSDYEFVVQAQSEFPDPEYIVYLDLDPHESIKRAASRGSSEIYDNVEKLTKVRQRYYEALKNSMKCGSNIIVIDASKSIQDVHYDIVSKVPYFQF